MECYGAVLSSYGCATMYHVPFTVGSCKGGNNKQTNGSARVAGKIGVREPQERKTKQTEQQENRAKNTERGRRRKSWKNIRKKKGVNAVD